LKREANQLNVHGGKREVPQPGAPALPFDYLQSGQQPTAASFVAALAPVAAKAMSAIASPTSFAFMQIPPAHHGLTPIWRSIRHGVEPTGSNRIQGQAKRFVEMS
jgi:hypothetical protein